jgi:hypothetical protein
MTMSLPPLPVFARRITLRCLRDTDIGVFPEFRLGAFLQSVDAKHKSHGDSIALEVLRSAKMRYRTHEHFEFRLYAAPAHRARLERIEAMLRGLPGSACLSGPDIAFGDNWALHGIEDLYPFGPLTREQLDEEVAQWRGTARFRIRLASPWRILTSGRSDRRRKGDILMDPKQVDDELLGRLLTQSLVALKFQLGAREWQVPELPLRIVDQSLWYVGSPPSSGGKRPNVFEEGLIGECTVEWAEPPSDDHWRHLLLLARFGAGQSRAFGLGRMRLERIDRAKPAPRHPTDGLAELCERLLPNSSEFSALSRETARDTVIGLYQAGWRACLSIAMQDKDKCASGVASPEARLSSLLGTSDASNIIETIPCAQREILRRALRYTMLARTCQRLRLRMVWCEDNVLVLWRSHVGNARIAPPIREALSTEGVEIDDHTVRDIRDPLDFAWCGFRFIGGLRLPGRQVSRTCAIDERIDEEATSHQAA